ncbi:MAG: HU family DNA-binding protein [Oscillospiraceae bacterium]|jgi:DNA-binding protein HU-beta|nr:HU family DNA-binding protein [Oscillospiraceae bacterium]
MNKTDFINKLAEQEGIEKKAAEKYTTAVLAALESALTAGEKVQFVGFGSFEVRDRAEKKVRNIKTGEALIAPATKVPVFKPGKALKEAVAGK